MDINKPYYYEDFIQVLKNMSEQESIIYVYKSKDLIKSYIDLFISHLEETFLYNDPNDTPIIELSNTIREIGILHQALRFDLKVFLNYFNKCFDYKGNTDIVYMFKRIYWTCYIDILESKDVFQDLINFKKVYPFNDFNARDKLQYCFDNLFLRLLLDNKQVDLKYYKSLHKIEEHDFNQLIIKKLSIDQLIEIIKHKWCYNMDEIYQEMMIRIEYMDKLYSLDIKTFNDIDQIKKYLQDVKQKYDLANNIDMLDLIQQLKIEFSDNFDFINKLN